MALLALAKDVKVWVFLAVLLGLLIGFDSPHTSVMLMGVLIVQMILNLHGMRIEKEDFGRYRKGSIIGVICCFVRQKLIIQIQRNGVKKLVILFRHIISSSILLFK